MGDSQEPQIDPYEHLSSREQQILDLVAHGATNQQIANALGIRFATVKGYLADVLHKTGAQSRTEAGCEWTRRREHRRSDGAERTD